MSEEIKIALYLGMNEKGRHRLAALRTMAADAGHFWDNEPSPGRFIAAQIDRWLEDRQTNEAKLEAN